ncbi:gibberellin receptor GID1C-like isoform X2 [Amaranthus tricolor]|uniref:gibberellin receptor GID1C-like isoform X2 n=1 Tax=Amaranthus tricolor TaxID=29722 RepID=UPI00258F634A|nr:gibberellin receptor GID1C-like isoform X2 [Amaranthus tricolor]
MAPNDGVNVNESKRVVPLNTWVLISQFKLAYNMLRHPDGSFNRHLAEYLDRKVVADPNPVQGVFSFDVVVDHSTNLVCRVYRTTVAEEVVVVGGQSTTIINLEKPVESDVIVPVIIFFHGGSFAHSSASSGIYDVLCRRLVGFCNAVVVSVNYRRAPENRYPCAYDDGWTVVKWVNSRNWLQSKDSKVHIYLAGDSSGGNIAHNVAVTAIDSEIEVLGNILLNPMFGGQERTKSEQGLDGKYFVTLQDRDWYWRAFLPEGENRDHPACNPFGPRGRSLEGLKFPKSLVVVAGLDLIQDWQLAYVEGLKKAGHDVKLLYLEQATIGFYLLPNNNHFFTVMDEIRKFVGIDQSIDQPER